MEKTLKEKTTTALIWSFIDKFGQQIIYFVTGIILARNLTPSDYGLIGILNIFISFSTILIGSGYGRAILNRQNIKQEELNTIFLYYLIVGFFLYLILFICAPLISRFFDQPSLIILSRVSLLSVIFISFSSIQDIIFLRNMDLKKWAKANFFSLFPASVLSIIAVYNGYGVWSLVIQSLGFSLLKVFFYWYYGGWRPSKKISKNILGDLYPVSIKILITGLINNIFNNLFPILIGRIYGTSQLGFFTQANKYQEIPSGLINNSFKSVSTPLLSSVNTDDERLKRVLSKLIKTVSFICFPLMLGMILISRPMIIVLITEKWSESINIFRILCISGMFLTINNVLQESILSKGKSGTLLFIEIIKKIILSILIIITLKHGALGLSIGLATSSFFTLLISVFASNKYLNYSLKDIIHDTSPYLFISLTICFIAYLISLNISNDIFFIIFNISFITLFYLISCKLLKLNAYNEFEFWVISKINKIKH